MPLVTKCIVLGSTALMAAVSLDLASPAQFCLDWGMVFSQHQYWRLVTCFLYAGDFGMNFAWSMYVLFSYSSILEEQCFYGRTEDYLWMLICCCGMILTTQYITNSETLFNMGSLLHCITYVWSRRNAHLTCYIVMLEVRATFIPWVMLALSVLVGGSVEKMLFGILIGHVFWFFLDVYPNMPTSKGLRIFKTPAILTWLFNRRTRRPFAYEA